jgi:hypothetical protein
MALEDDIRDIKERNNRVELDKAWETSWARRVFIASVTFIVASIWLRLIKESDVFLKAIVPTAGYLLSTLSLPQIKKVWINRKTV